MARRWLLVGSGAQGSLEVAYLRALEMNGIQPTFFDVSKYRPNFRTNTIVTRVCSRLGIPIWRRRLQATLANACVSDNFEAVLVFKGGDFSREALEDCRRLAGRASWINLNPDNPLNLNAKGSTNANIKGSLSFFDIYVTWTPMLRSALLSAGCRRVEVLPFGFDPSTHYPASLDRAERPSGIFFAGAWDEQREELLSNLSKFDLQVFGFGWNRVSRKSGLRRKVMDVNIYGRPLAEHVTAAAVCLNILRPQNAGNHNMRTFEIPAMNGLMLTTRSAEQHVFFPEHEACLMYTDRYEMVSVVDRVVRTPASFESIRRSGNARSYPHSYFERARQLSAIVEEHRSPH